jgi:hypothetical protein
MGSGDPMTTPPENPQERLRGPLGGYARADVHLAAFWEEVRAAGPDRMEAGAGSLAALDAWLGRDGPPFAVVLGPPPLGAGRTLLLARWAWSVIGRAAADVAFLPVDRRLGTAIERDALRLLYGLLPRTGDSGCSGLRTLEEARQQIRLELASNQEGESHRLVVVVEGIDRAERWSLPTRGRPFEPGAGVRVLVSADTPSAGGAEAAAEALCARQGWSRSDVETFVLPTLLEEGGLADVEGAIQGARAQLDGGPGGDTIRGCLALLAAALRPMDLDDLSALSGQQARALLDQLDRGWGALGRLLERRDQQHGYRFRDEVLRRAWQAVEPAAVEAAERRIVDAGREAMRAVGAGRAAPAAVLPYLVDNLGAHLFRIGAPADDLAALVGAPWLEVWETRPQPVAGFLADVGWARERAQTELCSPVTIGGTSMPPAAEAEEPRDARAHLVTAVVRCALVEGAVISMDREDDPDLEPGIYRRRPTGAGHFRAEALVALAEQIEPPRRSILLDQAYEITRREVDGRQDADLLLALAAALPGPRRVELARESVAALRALPDHQADESAAGLLRAAAFLPVEEGRLLAAEAVGRVKSDVGWLADIAAGLPEELILELCRASDAPGDERRMTLLGSLAARLSPARHPGPLGEAARLYAGYFEHLPPAESPESRHVIDFARIAPLLPEPLVERTLPEVVTRVLREGEGSNNECALLELGRHLRGSEQERVLAAVRERLQRPRNWYYVLERCPSDVCALIGPAGALALLDQVRELGVDFDGITSAARLAPCLPPGMREALVAEVVADHLEGGDDDCTLPWVLRCARWMTMADRARVLCAPSTRSWALNLASVLHAHGWLPLRAELIHLLGGEAAVLGAAREIVETAEWLP